MEPIGGVNCRPIRIAMIPLACGAGAGAGVGGVAAEATDGARATARAVAMVAMSFMPVKPAHWMYAVPLLGQQIGISDLLRGIPVAYGDIGLALVCGFAFAAVLGLITAVVYRSERLAISA